MAWGAGISFSLKSSFFWPSFFFFTRFFPVMALRSIWPMGIPKPIFPQGKPPWYGASSSSPASVSSTVWVSSGTSSGVPGVFGAVSFFSPFSGSPPSAWSSALFSPAFPVPALLLFPGIFCHIPMGIPAFHSCSGVIPDRRLISNPLFMTVSKAFCIQSRQISMPPGSVIIFPALLSGLRQT